jgi:LacI family transcriptional regulator
MQSPRAGITMKDVAALAGVDASTVSLALRGDPRITPATAERIRAVAAELNYQPHPLIAALNAVRRRGQIHSYQANLAFVSFYADRDRLQRDPFQAGLYQGAECRAKEQGYGMEHIWFHQPGMNKTRFIEVLKSRGIRGLVLAPLDNPGEVYPLNWQGFAAIGLGLSALDRDLPRIVHDNYRAMLMLLEQLNKENAGACGLCIDHAGDQRTLGMWTAAYECHKRWNPGRCVRPLIMKTWNSSRFDTWCRSHRLTHVISVYPFIGPIRERLNSKLRKKDQTPKLFSLSLPSRKTTEAGIYQEPDRLGSAAVDQLIQTMHQSGQAAGRKELEIAMLGSWCDGRAKVSEP